MATVEVLAQSLAETLDVGDSFVYETTINTSKVLPKATSELPQTVKKQYFILNKQSFIDLQIYLKAALKLPSSQQNFEDTYPKTWFAEYFSKDKKTPALYSALSSTLVQINTHCSEFQSDTLGPIISLAGYIANFGNEAANLSKELSIHLDKIQNAGSNVRDPEVAKNVEAAQEICDELIKYAKDTSDQCGGYVKALGAFKSKTVDTDKPALEGVSERSGALLPTTSQLDENIRVAMQKTAETLGELAKTQNAAKETAKANAGARWYYAVPWIGWGLAIHDTVTKNSAENAVREAQQTYDRIAAKAGEELMTAIMFREKCANLIQTMGSVGNAIKKAENALNEMILAFSKLETGLHDVKDKLEVTKGSVAKGADWRLTKAKTRMQAAEDTWLKVVDLAEQFQANGILIEEKAEEKPEEPLPLVTIESANYGGTNYTDYAKILFNDGENLLVRSVDPGFPDAWQGQKKTISIFHTFHKEQRLFICSERSGTHYLKAGPIHQSRDSSSVLNEVKPFPKPADVKVQILAIVYGINEVRDQNVYDYCYGKLRSKAPIEWRNDNLGGDTWPGERKSAVIYYTEDEGKTIKQCSGKEDESTLWTV